MDIFSNLVSLLGVIIVFILILLFCYLSLKYVGRGVVKRGGSANIKIIDRMILGQDKSIVIAKVGKKYYLLGVTSSGIHLISELQPDDIDMKPMDDKKETDGTAPFKNIFSDILLKKKH